MRDEWGLNADEREKVKAELTLAVNAGFIEDAGLEAVEMRRRKKNEKLQNRLKEGKIVYGITCYGKPAYLQHELTKFRLDFVSGKAAGYAYKVITGEEKERFYRENQDLFTRYFGDIFPYEDVEDVIEKRIREEEYYGLVQDILCQRP